MFTQSQTLGNLRFEILRLLVGNYYKEDSRIEMICDPYISKNIVNTAKIFEEYITEGQEYSNKPISIEDVIEKMNRCSNTSTIN